MIGFDAGSEQFRILDGRQVNEIHANLQSGADLTQRIRLGENLGVAFQGITPMGPFEITEQLALDMLRAAVNPNGRPNSNVIRR
jgi:hypothetical protein